MDIFKSKKFQAMLVGLIATVLVHIIPALQVIDLTEFLAVIVAYILGQGIADHGKEAVVAKAAVDSFDREESEPAKK